MIHIQDLLNRIRWDENFGQGDFEIGYYDRVEDKIIRVSFQHLHFPPGDHFAFELTGQNDETCSVPFHRVREVYKNGLLSWQR